MGCGALPVNVCFGDETAQPLQTCKYIVSSHFDAFNVEVPVIFMKTNGSFLIRGSYVLCVFK